jgi:hypothetical protein
MTEHARYRPRQKSIIVSLNLRVVLLTVRDLVTRQYHKLPVAHYRGTSTGSVAILMCSTRQYYYQRAARVLTEQFPETAATHPELVAHHYVEAACYDQAVPCWQHAGQRALECSAHMEAVVHLIREQQLLAYHCLVFTSAVWPLLSDVVCGPLAP